MRKKIGYRLTLSVGTHTVYDDTFATSTEAKRLGAQMVYDQFAKTHDDIYTVAIVYYPNGTRAAFSNEGMAWPPSTFMRRSSAKLSNPEVLNGTCYRLRIDVYRPVALSRGREALSLR